MTLLIQDFSDLIPYLDGTQFDENLKVKFGPRGRVPYRNDLLIEMCRGMSVLHIGCCDHAPIIAEKIKKNEWLHGSITECARRVIGIDIDQKSVNIAREISGLENIYHGNIADDNAISEINNELFDIALLGEVLEHIANPVQFLSKFRTKYGKNFKSIVITVPNAFRAGNVRGIWSNHETINSDHRFFFTPFTLAKVTCDAGFLPVSLSVASFNRTHGLKARLINCRP